MKRPLVLLLCLFFSLSAEWESLFLDDGDPSIFQHVDVISGTLSLYFEDAQIRGAMPLSLFRTYSSSGALERNSKNSDLKLKKLRGGFLIQGGWNLFPHANMLVEYQHRLKFKVSLQEPSGGMMQYTFRNFGQDGMYLLPSGSRGQGFGRINGRTNPSNNLIRINPDASSARLLLPNGGWRDYSGEKFTNKAKPKSVFWQLRKEKLPSGHFIDYSYSNKKDKHLKFIALKSPQGKILSWIRLHYPKDNKSQFQAITSDGKEFTYNLKTSKEREYIHAVTSNCHPEEYIAYTRPRKEIGLAASLLSFNGEPVFTAHYVAPPDDHNTKKREREIGPYSIAKDKVNGLSNHLGWLARFSYHKPWTDVRDINGILTRYHKDYHTLTAVEYFDENQKTCAYQKFIWQHELLKVKAFCDCNGNPLFAKHFKYDSFGNVTEEILEGNLSGKFSYPFLFDEEGFLINAEQYRKRYSYNAEHLLEKEEEDEGPTYIYHYHPGTDLLTAKITFDKGRIVMREFFRYDDDHLLIEEIVDDGVSEDPQDLTLISERQIKRYTRTKEVGLPISISEFYLEGDEEKLFKRTDFTYSNRILVTEEKVYDSTNSLCYTLYTDYNSQDHIIRKTTPLGAENTYSYDSLGRLTQSKEVGSPTKCYTYDALGRPISCFEVETGKTTNTTYDAKGRIISETDTDGHETLQTYDAFGRCVLTTLPSVLDENKTHYCPTTSFAYDMQGNLTAYSTPLGETTKTTYNTFRKETKIIYPDRSEINHTYNLNGTLKQTIEADGTKILYTYDAFKRMIRKETISPSETFTERWFYGTFRLLAYVDKSGLSTTYSYDGMGRKTHENTFDRSRSFSYDRLGFLEKTTEGDISHIQVHDVEGRVIREWYEGKSGQIENEMQFRYDSENRKIEAIRITSKGDAKDTFSYHPSGKLASHKDPEGNLYTFLYPHLQKISIDPLQNRLIETTDALDRPIEIKHQDKLGITTSKEELFYDRSGNQKKRLTHIYSPNHLTRTIETSWEYDRRGNMVKQIESEAKVTLYSYDVKGRLCSKTTPNGITLTYTYDPLNRITSLTSSDNTISYTYLYKKGPHPIAITDNIHNQTLYRSYNAFHELTQEITPIGLTYSWTYTPFGECSSFTLPDKSSIEYTYREGHMCEVKRLSSHGELLYTHTYLSFDPNGHVAKESLICSLGTIDSSRDLLERPSTQTSPWCTHSLAYGPSGLVTEKQNSLFGNTSYTYDTLSQLTSENDKEYQFDSLGNPINAKLNNLNQILETPLEKLSYDKNGNLTKRLTSTGQITYTYDALDRLILITYPDKTKTHFSYDPLSRLISKTTDTTQYYLYNNNTEIGTLNQDLTPRDLKILGLGVLADIGAAIALEIDHNLYAPLHDFSGHMIALIHTSGSLHALSNLDAFGSNITPTLNPWPFSSKRLEDNLIFFGFRFYDPKLSRWLTPDPIGPLDSPNLYLYVLNNPLNRLDLFGLTAQDPELIIDYRPGVLSSNCGYRQTYDYAHFALCKGSLNGVPVDVVIASHYLYKLKFSPEEQMTGKINILNHIHELTPSTGSTIALITAQNGINNTVDDFRDMCCSIYKQTLPESPLFIGVYSRSEGVVQDTTKAMQERTLYITHNEETPHVIETRQFLSAVSETLYKINPALLWMHVSHSRAGVLALKAIEGMTSEQKGKIRQQLYAYNIAPAECISNLLAHKSINVFSDKDRTTRPFAMKYISDKDYDIRIVPAMSKLSFWERQIEGDHGFAKETQQYLLQQGFDDARDSPGFYKNERR